MTNKKIDRLETRIKNLEDDMEKLKAWSPDAWAETKKPPTI